MRNYSAVIAHICIDNNRTDLSYSHLFTDRSYVVVDLPKELVVTKLQVSEID
jgi:hypothetical protein